MAVLSLEVSRMHRQRGAYNFPSMAGFMGDKPSKRPRMEEPPKETNSVDMKAPASEFEDEEEVWEELDETAMDECMILATQMNTQLQEDYKGISRHAGNNNNKTVEFQNKKGTLHSSMGTLIKTEDSSSPSTSAKSTDHNDSLVFHNPVKNKNTTKPLDNSLKNNSYSNRFNDFAGLSTNPKLSATSRAAHNSGKVYNSIPMKGAVGMGVNSSAVGASSSGIGQPSATENYQRIKVKTDEETAKLQEEVLLKQGEISLLRAELQRKEATLEAERLDRIAAIEAAEKRGKEKAAFSVLDAETKIKEYDRKIERLQGELHFKNREVQELENQCRRLETQAQQQCLSPSSQSLSVMKKSPSKPTSNFKDRFNFSGREVSVKCAEVQTDTFAKQSKQRHRLQVTSSRGKGCGRKQIACLFSSYTQGCSKESTSHSINRLALDDHWTDLFSHIMNDYQDDDEVQKQILNQCIETLEEIQSRIVSERSDVTRSPILKTCSLIEEYEDKVVPAFIVIKCITSPQHCKNYLQKTLQAVCFHLSPLSVKGVIVNNRILSLVLQAVEHLARLTPPHMDKAVCQIALQSIRDHCDQIDTAAKLISVIQVLGALSLHKHFLNSLCSAEGNCLIGKLCSLINTHQEKQSSVITSLQEWTAVILTSSPDWLYSTCSCSAKLLAVYLKQVYFALDVTRTTNEYEKTALRKLLLTTVRLLHCWSSSDSCWWEKVAHLPHYTAVMGAVIDNAKVIQADRQTVDLLCDLYEFDEKIFENC